MPTTLSAAASNAGRWIGRGVRIGERDYTVRWTSVVIARRRSGCAIDRLASSALLALSSEDGPPESVRRAIEADPHRCHDHRHGRRFVEPGKGVERHHAEVAESRLPRHPGEPARDRDSRRALLSIARRRAGTHRHRRRVPPRRGHAGDRRRGGDDWCEDALVAKRDRERGRGGARVERRADGRHGRVYRRHTLSVACASKDNTPLTRPIGAGGYASLAIASS